MVELKGASYAARRRCVSGQRLVDPVGQADHILSVSVLRQADKTPPFPGQSKK